MATSYVNFENNGLCCLCLCPCHARADQQPCGYTVCRECLLKYNFRHAKQQSGVRRDCEVCKTAMRALPEHGFLSASPRYDFDLSSGIQDRLSLSLDRWTGNGEACLPAFNGRGNSLSKDYPGNSSAFNGPPHFSPTVDNNNVSSAGSEVSGRPPYGRATPGLQNYHYRSYPTEPKCQELQEAAKKQLQTLRTAHKDIVSIQKAIRESYASVCDQLDSTVSSWVDQVRQKAGCLKKNLEDVTKLKMKLLAGQVSDLETKISALEDAITFIENSGIFSRHLDKIDSLIRRYSQLCLDPAESDQMGFLCTDDELKAGILKAGVITSNAYADMTYAIGEGVETAIQNREIGFIVITCDHLGNKRATGDEPISVSLSSSLSPNVRSTRFLQVTDNKNGTYTVRYAPTSAGAYSLSVNLRGRQIKGSPFTLSVKSECHRADFGAVIRQVPSEFAGLHKFNRPWGVCTDKEGFVYVADRSNYRILIFTPNFELYNMFGTPGAKEGQFNLPAGLAVDTNRKIIVTDKDNHRIQVFDFTGKFLLCFGKKGKGAGEFSYPWDVAVNENNNVIAVTDTRNHRVQFFDENGAFQRQFPDRRGNTHRDVLNSPRGICFTKSGVAAVTDFNSHRVVLIFPDMSSRTLGSQGRLPGCFYRPQAIDVDHLGNLLVADSRNHRIQIINHHGTCLYYFGTYGKGSNQMDTPTGMCVSPGGHIIVVDFKNNRLQKY